MVLACAFFDPTAVEPAVVVVRGLAVAVEADVGMLTDGVELAVVERFVDPQAATASASTTVAVVR